MVVLIPVDARYSKGKQKDVLSLFRSLIIGRALLGSPHKLAIDAEVGARLKSWKSRHLLLNNKLTNLRRNWLYPHTTYDRRSLSHQISQVEDDIQKHLIKLPLVLDYQENRYALALQNEMEAHAQSGLKTLKDWEARAKDWISRLGAATATTITWGVIMINFINTALLYDELTRDGEFSERDMIKIGYGLGYSFNLLMGVFVETPWAVIKAAQPVIIEGKTIGILQRSSTYWMGRGNIEWGNAVRGFRVGMVAVGAFGIMAAALELFDLYADVKSAKTVEETTVIVIKGLAVSLMGLGPLSQLVAGMLPASGAAAVVLSSWLTIALAFAGAVYLIATMVANYLQQDSVGLWLRKSSWSATDEHRIADNPAGHAEEISTLLEIQNSPTIYVKSTYADRLEWIGKSGYIPQTVQSGAWIQVSLPSTVRGKTLRLSIISTERPFPGSSIEKSKGPIAQQFLESGCFSSTKTFTTIDERYGKGTQDTYFPPIPPSEENIMWQVWVPLSKTATFMELQIWPPAEAPASSKPRAYLFQVELEANGQLAADGLIKTKLTVQSVDPSEAIALEIPAHSKGNQP